MAGTSGRMPSNESAGVSSRMLSPGAPLDDYITLDIQRDVYDAVVVASFGGLGVHMEEENNDTGEPAFKLPMHPLIVLVCFSWPLYVVQMTVLWALGLDLELESEVLDWSLVQTNPRQNLLFVVKSLMVIVLGNMSIQEFIHAIRPLFMVVNPYTWVEFKRPKWLEGRVQTMICFVCCVVAESMQLLVAYNVLVLSLSIILRGEGITDVIFNSLALIFITEIDEATFEAAAVVFHWDPTQYDKLVSDGFRIVPLNQPESTFQWLSWSKSKVTPDGRKRKGRGRADGISFFLSFFAIEALFVRQLLVYWMAVQTGILPTARDFCAMYEGLHGRNIYGWLWATQIEMSVAYIDFKKQVQHKLEDTLGPECGTDKYETMTHPGAMRNLHWSWMLLFIICIMTFVFVIYQLVAFNLSRIMKNKYMKRLLPQDLSSSAAEAQG